MDLNVFSRHIRNKQFIMAIAGILLFCLGILYRFIARREKYMQAKAAAESAAVGIDYQI
jgi:hypothetical protein